MLLKISYQIGPKIKLSYVMSKEFQALLSPSPVISDLLVDIVGPKLSHLLTWGANLTNP